MTACSVHLVIGCTAINILLWEEQIVLTETVMASRGPILNTHQIYIVQCRRIVIVLYLHLIALEAEVLLEAPVVGPGVGLVRDVDLVVVEGKEVVRVRPRPRPRQQLQILVAGVVVLELVAGARLAPAPKP